METEKALLIAKTMMWTGIIGAILTLIGEYLGWWNEIGEVMLTITTIGGALGAVAAIVIGSSSEEVQAVHGAVEANGRTLVSVDRRLGSVDGRLGSVDGKLESVDGKLESVDGKLASMDDKLASLEKLEMLDTVDTKLDAVEVQLDRQTGVLDRQVDLLTEIRDRL